MKINLKKTLTLLFITICTCITIAANAQVTVTSAQHSQLVPQFTVTPLRIYRIMVAGTTCDANGKGTSGTVNIQVGAIQFYKVIQREPKVGAAGQFNGLDFVNNPSPATAPYATYTMAYGTDHAHSDDPATAGTIRNGGLPKFNNYNKNGDITTIQGPILGITGDASAADIATATTLLNLAGLKTGGFITINGVKTYIIGTPMQPAMLAYPGDLDNTTLLYKL